MAPHPGKLGDVVELLEKLAQFLIPDRLNGEADAFPGASAHSRALTPPFRPNRCTKQFPHSILDCPSDFCPTLAVDRIARQSNSTISTTSPIDPGRAVAGELVNEAAGQAGGDLG